MNNLTFPDLQTLLDGNVIDIIKYIFTTIFTVIIAALDYIYKFTEVLVGVNKYILDLIASIETGKMEGLPFFEVIGAYRFLVGDIVFNLTYLTVVTGAFFTLYKLLLVLYRWFKDTKTDSLTNNSLDGIIGMINKFFKK